MNYEKARRKEMAYPPRTYVKRAPMFTTEKQIEYINRLRGRLGENCPETFKDRKPIYASEANRLIQQLQFKCREFGLSSKNVEEPA